MGFHSLFCKGVIHLTTVLKKFEIFQNLCQYFLKNFIKQKDLRGNFIKEKDRVLQTNKIKDNPNFSKHIS